MADCTSSQCSSCAAADGCQDKDRIAKLERNTGGVHHMFGVVGGKGGVGKSLITSLLAIQTQKMGYKTAVLDADITGPSIPRIFGVHAYAGVEDDTLLPHVTSSGTKIMSLNMLLENETDPVFWRGPVISNVMQQLWEETKWGEINYMFVDMPPGTGDVPLTVFQSLPVEGIIIATTPQSLVSMIVQKAVNMAEKMDIPILGMIENMQYIVCPDCGKKISLFGSDESVDASDVPVLERLPLDPALSTACDNGTLASLDVPYLAQTAKLLTESFLPNEYMDRKSNNTQNNTQDNT